MLVLALDTTNRAGSVALVEDDRLVEERAGDPARSHAERLPAEITALLAARAVRLAEVDLYAVASGPGSFTGLRIGIATVQGLAFVNHRPVVGVSALDALAEAAAAGGPPGALVAVWMDARRGEVFSALYRVRAPESLVSERLVELEGAAVGDPESTLARWEGSLDGHASRFVGDGAELYASLLRSRAGDGGVIVQPTPALAGVIGRIARRRAALGAATEPGTVRPLYVRRPDAERDRDRRR